MNDESRGLGDGYLGLRHTERTLPSTWYFDLSHYQRELEWIWYRSWIYVCRSSAINASAYRTYTIGTQTVLLVRDGAGVLRAFYNTCRHRGAELCPAGEATLKAKLISCRYHQWTYALSGELVRIPQGSTASDFDKTKYGLLPVALREWRGLVFVKLTGDDMKFDDAFDPAPSLLANWPLERLVMGYSSVREIACNWKIFWENYNECLHCPGVHPGLCEIVPIYGRGMQGEFDDPDHARHAQSGDLRHRGGLRAGAETWSMNGGICPPGFSGLTPAERASGHTFLTILPSCFIVAHADYARLVSMRPLDAEHTEIKAEWLFLPETLADPAFDLANTVDFALTVMREDAEVCEISQRGQRAIAYHAGVLMPEEYELHRLHGWVRDRLG